jgi:hypothetical protein
MNKIYEIADMADRISALTHDLELIEKDLDDLYLIGYGNGLDMKQIKYLIGFTGLSQHSDFLEYLNRLSDQQIKKFFVTD